MTKLQFDERQFKLTLPKKLLEALGWKKGDDISIELENNRIVLKNKTKKEEKIEYAG